MNSDNRDGSTKTPNDSVLAERCLRGDEEAWRMLVDRYARLVHSVPVRHGLAHAEVDDVGQEVFLALAQNLDRIEDLDRLPAWLLTTARRASWRLIAKQKRERTGLNADVGETEPSSAERRIGVQMPSMDDLVAAWDRQALLSQAMARLRERCRRLLALLYLDPTEPTYDEISQRLGMSTGSIGPTRSRCLAQLRKIVEGLGYDAEH